MCDTLASSVTRGLAMCDTLASSMTHGPAMCDTLASSVWASCMSYIPSQPCVTAYLSSSIEHVQLISFKIVTISIKYI